MMECVKEASIDVINACVDIAGLKRIGRLLAKETGLTDEERDELRWHYLVKSHWLEKMSR